MSNCYTQCLYVYTLCMQIASSSNINVVHRYDGTTLFNNSTPTHNSSFPSFLPSFLTHSTTTSARERERVGSSINFIRAKKGSLKLSQSPCDGATWGRMRGDVRVLSLSTELHQRRKNKETVYFHNIFFSSFFVYRQP